MKIIKLTLIALTFAFGQLHQSIQAMETPKIAEQKKYQPKNAEARKKLRMQKGKPVVRNFPAMQKNYFFYTHKKLNRPNINAMRELREQSIDNLVEKKKPKKTVQAKPIAEKNITSQASTSQPNNTQELFFQAPMEKEIINSNPHIEIINRSQNVQNDLEHAAITIYEPSQISTNGSTDLPNDQNDANDELEKTIVNIASLKHIDPETKKEAICVAAQLMSSNLSISTPELEDFPRPENLNQLTVIAADAISPMSNDNSNQQSSTNEKSNNIHEIHNELIAKRNQQIVKIANLINKKINEDNAQSILPKKQLTQEELFESTRNKIDQFTQVVDATYVQIFDKFITSTQQLPERKTSGFFEFYLNRHVYNNAKQDKFEILKFSNQQEITIESQLWDIQRDLNQIKDLNKRKELIFHFKQNKERWNLNDFYTEKTLSALMHDNKNKTSQALTNINIQNGNNRMKVTPLLYSKITALTNECTSNLQSCGNTIYDLSNPKFEEKNRIEKDKAEKYYLPHLINTANNISSSINTWMIRF